MSGREAAVILGIVVTIMLGLLLLISQAALEEGTPRPAQTADG